MKIMTFLMLAITILIWPSLAQPQEPVRLSVAGMSHGHVHTILRRTSTADFKLVGLAEADSALAMRLIRQYALDPGLWYADLQDMLDASKPEGVCAFGSIYDHLEVVRRCAPLGIHVMVEKPLAVNTAHSREMADLAKGNGIHLLTNYETSWYPSLSRAGEILKNGDLGTGRKLVIRNGHQGPAEIGVNAEFLAWLTDPVQNGGGAVIDFGCYGANISTWLMKNRRPESVTAVLQQFKPDIYPLVDDEATIILTYPGTVAVIQASWNWPFNRKDMDIYGDGGWLYADDARHTRVKAMGEVAMRFEEVPLLDPPNDDPYSYFAAVIRAEVDPSGSLSSLENNLIVVEILESAIRSAKEGKTVFLSE